MGVVRRHSEGATVDEMREAMQEQYGLDDAVVDRLEFVLTDCQAKVRHQKGDMIETDCNCDSAYMLSAMDRVGQAIRDSYHWIPRSDPCYLVMDNAVDLTHEEDTPELVPEIICAPEEEEIWQEGNV